MFDAIKQVVNYLEESCYNWTRENLSVHGVVV